MECVWCGHYFEPTTTYQKYCNLYCRRAATSEKIKKRSRLATIKRRSKRKRFCANGCGTQLSIYNDGKICQRCQVSDKLVNKALSDLQDFFEVEDETTG